MNIDESGLAQFTLLNEDGTIRFAEALAKAYQKQASESTGLIVYLKGDLGAGKSFFSRAFIQYFIPGQKVKSPTYNIVESYEADELVIHHFDLYRLCDPEELEYLAVRDLFVNRFVALIEWPQKGAPVLPEADMMIELKHPEIGGEEGRTAEILALSEFGQQLVKETILQMSKN